MAFRVVWILACIFVLGALANKEPRPCCWINQMTGEMEVQTDIELEDGTVVLVETKSLFAYDAVYSAKAFIFTEHFDNGTTKSSRYVYFFEPGILYRIEKHEGQELNCTRERIIPRFPRSCIPENAVFVKNLTLGDNALTSHQWHYDLAVRGLTAKYAFYVAADYCVPILFSALKHDASTHPPETGVKVISYGNIELGICDRDKFFHIPDECHQGVLSALNDPKLKHIQDLEIAFGNTV